MVSPSCLVAIVVLCTVSFGLSVIVTGVQGGVSAVTGWRPSRPPFEDFVHAGPAFDLYILSLRQFQIQNQSSQLSYFQIAAIHGRPFTEWGGVAGIFDAGYCAHESILFPMWHRPYLALFEQIIWENAQAISRCYPFQQRRQYQAAALTLRIPYWDWASNATMPDAVNQRHISINAPGGRVNTTNALYRYIFHPHPSISDFPPSDAVSQYNATVRYPDANGHSQPWKSNAQLQANAAALHDLTYQLLAEQSDYAPFSNRGISIGRNATYNSIENLHNAIHSLVGQAGHMGIIPYSSFDPIFWLHHANVDRLVAIWQAIYPDSFVTPQVSYEGTYTEVSGTIETIHSPLTPFYSNDNNGAFFTSSSARYLRHFGYTYPEIIDWNATSSQLSSNVRRILNSMYNSAGTLSGRSLSETCRPAQKPREWSIHPKDKVTQNHPSKSPPLSDNGSRKVQYFINIRVERSALNQSFFVHFFLGPIPQNPSSWSTAPTLTGTQAVLYSPSHLTKPNTMSTAYGQIPLNHALTSSSPHSPTLHPRSLAPSDVIPILTQHLCWRLQTLDRTTNDENSIDIQSHRQLRRTLKIFVIGREIVREGQGDQLPVFGPVEIWRAATEGKAGGLGEDEGM